MRYGIECSSERARGGGRTGGFLWVDGGYVSELKPLSPISRVKSKYNRPTDEHTTQQFTRLAESRQKLAKLKFICAKSAQLFFAQIGFWGCITNSDAHKSISSFIFQPKHSPHWKNQYESSLTFNISMTRIKISAFGTGKFLFRSKEREKQGDVRLPEFLCDSELG